MVPRLLAAALCLALAACAGPPAPVTGLTAPPAWAMAAPAPYPDVPTCDGDPACRARYYADLRARDGDLADRFGALRRWARLVTKNDLSRTSP